MTPEELQKIKARHEAATEGPWWKIILPWRDCTTEPYVFAGPTEDPHGGILVADSPLHEAIESDIDNEANMTFIAHALVKTCAISLWYPIVIIVATGTYSYITQSIIQPIMVAVVCLHPLWDIQNSTVHIQCRLCCFPLSDNGTTA